MPDFRAVPAEPSVAMPLIEPGSGRIVDADPAALPFDGHPREEPPALSRQRINAFATPQLAAGRALARGPGRIHFVSRHRLANGDWRTVEAGSRPLHAEGRPVLLAMIHDITSGRSPDPGVRHHQERWELLVAGRTAEVEARR